MFKKVLIASALLAAVAGANAQSTGFGVAGTITPSSCSISLGGAGIADYGGLTKVGVQGDNVVSGVAYYLGNKGVPITVGCSSPVRLELAFVDNKSAQRLTLDSSDTIRFGIADGSSTTALGSYEIIMNKVTLNGAAPAAFLAAPTGSTSWDSANVVPGIASTFSAPGHAIGFSATAGATVPDAVTTLGGNLVFNAFVSKAIVDASTGVLTLNGSGTINLQYL